MKVTFVAMNYAPSVGGAQAFMGEIAEALASRANVEVEVVTTNALRAPAARRAGVVDAPPSEVLRGVTVSRFPYGKGLHGLTRSWRRLRRRAAPYRAQRPVGPFRVGPLGLRFQLACWRAVRSADVVVTCPAPSLPMVAIVRLPFGRARRVLVPMLHRNEGEPDTLPGQTALSGFDAVVTFTEFESKVMQNLGVAPSAIHVIPPGCHAERYPSIEQTDARRTAGLPERETIGFVGRLTPYKGVDTILEAVPGLLAARPELTILLAGASYGWPEFESHVRALKSVTGDRVVVRQNFTEDERAVLLAACDIVLTPSRAESFGMVTLEAWAAGRPVIAGDIPAVRSFLRPGGDGLLVPVGDPDALTRATLELLEDAGRAERMGRAGRARAATEFEWGRITNRWYTLLTDLRGAPDKPDVATAGSPEPMLPQRS